MNYFLVYLLLEVFVSVNISSSIGAMATFLEIILSAMFGFVLLANFRNTFGESMQAMQRRTISITEFQKLNAFTLLGALLLILPGFFSDIIGIFLQFTFFATLFARKVLHVKDNIDIDDIQNIHRRKEEDEIIDVEVIDDRTKQ